MIIKKNVAKSDPKSDPLVATHTCDRNEIKITETNNNKENSPHKLLTNRKIPTIIQGVILPVNQTTTDLVATNGRALHEACAVLHKEMVPSLTRSTAGFLKDPRVINRKNTVGTITFYRNTVAIPPQNHYQSSDWYCTLCTPNLQRDPED